MSNSEVKQETELPPPPSQTAAVANVEAGTGTGTSWINRRWRREDMLKRGSWALRGLALVFSLLSFFIMVTNRHGDWKNFDNYEEYRYLVAISLLAMVYTAAQALRHVHELSTGRSVFERRISFIVDFAGDQITAYLLFSAASTAVPLTNRMREGADNIFTDASAASISMAFFAFFALAVSALISGYKLSNQSYI